MTHNNILTDTRHYTTHLFGQTDRPALIPIVTPRIPNNVK